VKREWPSLSADGEPCDEGRGLESYGAVSSDDRFSWNYKPQV